MNRRAGGINGSKATGPGGPHYYTIPGYNYTFHGW